MNEKTPKETLKFSPKKKNKLFGTQHRRNAERYCDFFP